MWWYQSVFDHTHNNYLTNILVPVPPAVADLLPAGSVYNYPNPNTADFTTIRYFLREDAQVRIRIFDLAGDLVDTFSGPGLGQQHNEVRWQLSAVASGVYLGRIEAQSEQTQQVRLIKILVIK
jgi:hypothetical protein